MAAPKDEHECKLRRQFASRNAANAAAARIAATQGKRRLAESCRFCNCWHLSDPQ